MSRSKNEHFVFVHGACCGAWVWKEIMNRLESMGLTTHAIDLPGHGLKKHLLPSSHRDYITALNSFILENDLKNVVLVGHSMGGSVIPYSAIELKDRVNRLIFYTTIFPEEGNNVLGVAPAFLEYFSKAYLFLTRYKPLTIPNFLLKILFCNDMNKYQMDEFLAQLDPQPARPIVTPFSAVDIHRFQSLYIIAEQDHAISPKKQREILSKIPNCQVKNINTGHFGMISQPDALVKLLVNS